jgi:hypothetical protein
LVHFYLTSSLLLGLLPIVVCVIPRVFCSLLNRKYIDHIQVLGFLSFPYFSSACSPLSVWPISFFGNTGIWNQALPLARQALYLKYIQ